MNKIKRLKLYIYLMVLAGIGYLYTANLKDKQKSNAQNNGLQIETLTQGTGPEAKWGDTLSIHETTRYTNDSLIFDSKGMDPIQFVLGAKTVIQGVEQGLIGAKKGEYRKLIVPPALSKRTGNVTFPHPDSTLVYHIKVISVNSYK